MTPVRIQNVSKRFGSVAALDAVSVEITAGELFFLLGPSGCGKTTLLRCLAGFYQPESGSIFFGDRDVTNLEAHRRETGMVFQNYALWPHMTVAENVAFGLEQRKVPKPEIRERVAAALEAVRMGGLGERRPNQLSGGQQQRVALARALVIRPQCLLLDEPLSNLDAKLRTEMRLEIRRVCKEAGLTAVYVTHDQKEALSIADRVAVMHEGRIRQVGPPAEIYRRPRSRFVADFLGDTNFIEGRVLRIGADEALVQTAMGEFRGILADPESPPAEGATVTVSVRPECLRLDTYPADENCFHGQIGEAVYFGDSAHYAFETETGARLQLAELNPRHAGPRAGELYVWVAPEDVVILAG